MAMMAMNKKITWRELSEAVSEAKKVPMTEPFCVIRNATVNNNKALRQFFIAVKQKYGCE